MSRTRPLTPPDQLQTRWDEPKGDKYVPNFRRYFPIDHDANRLVERDRDEDDIEITFIEEEG